MSGSGLPILISRNCFRASKNAKVRRLEYCKNLAGFRLTHQISLFTQPPIQSSCLTKFTSYHSKTLQRPFSTSSQSNSARYTKSLCAIKHQNISRKNDVQFFTTRSSSSNYVSALNGSLSSGFPLSSQCMGNASRGK